MILVGVDCFELKIGIVLVNGLNSGHDEGLYAVVDDFASVFCREHQVIIRSETYSGRQLASSLVINWKLISGTSRSRGGHASRGLTARELWDWIKDLIHTLNITQTAVCLAINWRWQENLHRFR